MGRIIRLDNGESESPAILTQTGKGGLLSSGYLREEPAAAHLQDETPVFVLTNQKRGVEIERDGSHERITSGKGFRTITVVTDRRIVVLVGESSHENVDGDQQLSVPFTEIESVTSEGGRRGGTFAVRRSGDTTWTIHAGQSGLDAVEEYVRAAIEAWTHVESTIDGVTRALVNALDRRDNGEYDDALDAAQAATDQLEDAVRTARGFDREWPGTAMLDRVLQVADRCKNTLATVRVGRARQFTDRAERRWRDDDLTGARDAYGRAQSEYDTVRAMSSDAIEDWDRIEAEAERVDRTIEQLEDVPLQAAIEADRAASDADDDETAAAQLERAIDLYQDAIEIDQDAPERRFTGDPEEIRARREDVIESLTSTRRNIATNAKQAGEWYIGSDQYELAIEEFETARDQFERAIEVATQHYPDAVDHLETDLEAVEESLERVRALRDGDAVDPVETAAADDEPDYAVEATIGTTERDAGEVDTQESETGTDTNDASTAGADIEQRLRDLDEDRFGAVVATVLGETGWTTEATSDDTIVVAKDTPTTERMLVRLYHRPDGEAVTEAAIEACRDLRAERSNVDAVMMATSAGITDEATRLSREGEVRLLDDECLAAVIESRDLEDELVSNAVELD